MGTRTKMNITVPLSLLDKIHSIPWGIRSALVCSFLERAVDAQEKYGNMIYGAIIDGNFKIEYENKKDVKGGDR